MYKIIQAREEVIKITIKAKLKEVNLLEITTAHIHFRIVHHSYAHCNIKAIEATNNCG